jgi:hypothetical protein
MTQHRRNTNPLLPTSRDVREIARLVILALASLALPVTTSAADKPSKPVRVSVSRLGAADDLDVEIHVRRALGKDEALKRLSVHMAGGVAHLFGPVPSVELKKKAVEIATGVPGVLEVRADEVYLAKAAPKAKPLVLPLEGDRPTQTQSASPTSLSEVVEPSTSREPLTPAKPNPISHSSLPSRPTWPGEAGVNSSTPQRVTLMAPETVAAPPRATEPAVLTANPRTAPTSLATAIDRLRQGDRRFRSIRTEVHGSTIRVLSGDAPSEHVMAFVQSIRRLPGVQHVILKDTSTRPN